MRGRVGLPNPGADAQIVAGAWNLPMAIPNFRVRGYRVPELAPTSSWRSVGASTNGFFVDCFLDELIHAAGADPMEERLRLASDDAPRKVLGEIAILTVQPNNATARTMESYNYMSVGDFIELK